MPRILILLAHPQLEQSRAAASMVDALQATLAAPPAGLQIELRDLYARYPDYLIDVPAEQAALAGVDLLVWLHPIHWYGMPPLMKLWLDEVLAFGWAYGPGGLALRGIDLWLALSTGGPASSYRSDGHNRYFFEAFLPPYEQTAALTGMRFLPPLVLHGALHSGQAELLAHAEVFVQRLRSWPAWPELAGLPACPACEVPGDARPAPAQAQTLAPGL